MIWLTAPNRAAVTQAQFQVDQILAADPRRGKHLAEGLFAIEVLPLKVYYEIDEANQRVVVTDLVAR